MRTVRHMRVATMCAIVAIMLIGTHILEAQRLPPDPDNAALLYYQAFVARPKADQPTWRGLSEFMGGAEADPNVKTYIRSCRESIRLAEAAAELPYCRWGIRYSLGLGYQASYLLETQRICHLFRLDGRLLTSEGDYDGAFNRCLTIRKMATHIGDYGTVGYLCSMGEDLKALNDIRDVLGVTASDAERLVWLKRHLLAPVRPLPSFDRALRMDLELALQTLRTNDGILSQVRHQLTESAAADNPTKHLETLTDEELLARAKKPYTQFLDAALFTIESSTGYEQVYAQLQQLERVLNSDHGADPAARQVIEACARSVLGVYDVKVFHAATLHSLIVATEVYLIKATTGQLPQALPDELPTDPYSGEDFEYVTTESGFRLRSRRPDVRLGKARAFDFYVRP